MWQIALLIVAAFLAEARSEDGHHGADAGNVVAGLLGAAICIVLVLAGIGYWARRARGL